MCCAHLSRRQFLGTSSGLLAAGTLGFSVAATPPAWADDRWDPGRPFAMPARPLRVLPVLMYRTPTPREKTSWKSWGGVQTDSAANEEVARIAANCSVSRANTPYPRNPAGRPRQDRGRGPSPRIHPARRHGRLSRDRLRRNAPRLYSRSEHRHLHPPPLRPGILLVRGAQHPLPPAAAEAAAQPAPTGDRLLSVDDVVVDNLADRLAPARPLRRGQPSAVPASSQ